MIIRNPIRKTALAVAIASVAVLATAQDVTLYESHVLPEALVFEPNSTVGMNSDIDIVIKGPNDLLLQQSFAAGEPIELNPAALIEGGLPDGTYRYELKVMAINGVTAERNGQIRNVPEIAQPGFGAFTIRDGKLVSPDEKEPLYTSADAGASAHAAIPTAAETGEEELQPGTRQVISGDLTVYNSLCVGTDCAASESYGFDTMRLKENNLRIHFDDTSNSASFPSNDWRLTANDSANGGLSRFTIEDATAGRNVFTVEAGAPSHSLYVDDGGRIGMGTMMPVVEAHIVDGDTPTIRLQQDGSSGFAQLTWDIAGNETNFFVRDVTNGSKLPFKIRPNADTNSLVVEANGDVTMNGGNLGIGTTSPSAPLDVSSTNSFNNFRITATGAAPNTQVDLTYTDAGAEGEFRINIVDGDNQEFSVDADGNVVIDGTLTANGSTFPDYVFKDEYRLMPLAEVEAFIKANGHLPNVPSAEQIARDGLDMTAMQKKLFEKVEELTLYTLEQQRTIEQLRDKVNTLQSLAEAK